MINIIIHTWLFLDAITFLMLGNFIYLLSSADFFGLNFFHNYKSEYQTVWIQIMPDILSGMIWVQTVCKVISSQQKWPLVAEYLMPMSNLILFQIVAQFVLMMQKKVLFYLL